MADSHNCQRCSQEETIIHQTVTCPYVREIWDLATKVTGSLNIDLSSILGVNQNHSKTTFTLNLEIIKPSLFVMIEKKIFKGKIYTFNFKWVIRRVSKINISTIK